MMNREHFNISTDEFCTASDCARTQRWLIRRATATIAVTMFASVVACSPRGGSATKEGSSAAAQGQQEATSSAARDTTTRNVDWARVDQALDRSGKMQDDGSYKYSMGRSDMHVTLEGVAIKPALSLGSWLAMKPKGDGVVAMGDLVLAEGEVSPVMTKLQEAGIMQTALHNHLLHETPRVTYMHIHAEGDPVKIAQGIHDALALTKTPMPAQNAATAPTSQPLGIDTAGIDQALGRHGNTAGGVYHINVARAETITDAGIDVPPSMGTATAINFQPTGGGKAAINGDFVMIASEVNPVIHALKDNGIEVLALHSHMLGEQPRLLFMHYWANDDAVKLARGLRAALDKMNTKAASK
jgi:hypothetical protein